MSTSPGEAGPLCRRECKSHEGRERTGKGESDPSLGTGALCWEGRDSSFWFGDTAYVKLMCCI